MNSALLKKDVLARLAELKRADPDFKIFSAVQHQYELNAPLDINQVSDFESNNDIFLPEDYKCFITEIGNGGAGPFYGVFPFGFQDDLRGFCTWANGGLVGDLSADFPHQTAWNLPESFWENMPDPGPEVSDEEEDRMNQEWYQKLESQYWNSNIMNGAIPICHEGCAYRQWLVVTGKQRGFIWADGRAGDAGVAPVLNEQGEPQSFTDWYSAWLEDPS